MIRVVTNPSAGGYSPALAAEVARRCRGRDADLVVAVGGDGTAGRLAAELAYSATPMAVVPAGTANSYYRTLWGSVPWRESLDAALAGAPPLAVDLARVLGLDRVALSGVSAGLPAQAIHRAKAAGTSYAAALAGLAEGYDAFPGRVLADGRTIHSGRIMLVNVGGSRYRGGDYALLPRTVLDDGLLDVCVIGAEHDVREMLALTRTGAHLGMPGVAYARARRVDIERTDGRPLWFEHDGEVLDGTGSGVTLGVAPHAVRVVAPVSRR